MYSLTQATQLFLHHAQTGSQNGSSEVQKYNSHKIRHSLWVLETGRNLIIKIQENTPLSSEFKNRAEIVFILHDLGRFYQNNGERVLKNSEYEHGDKSYKLAQIAQYDEWICLAIKYHNKYSHLPLLEEPSFLSMNPKEQEETLFLAKLARDADKLQNMIYTVFNIDHILKLDPYSENLKREDISEINREDVKKHVQIDRKNIYSVWDYLLSTLCWIFDINFQESVETLHFYWYFEKIIQKFDELPEISQNSLKIIKENILNYKL